MPIIHNNIKYLRSLNGLSQMQLSEKLGIKRSLLNAYEKANSTPGLENLLNIAKMFGTSVDILIKNDLKKNKIELKVEKVKIEEDTYQILTENTKIEINKGFQKEFEQSLGKGFPLNMLLNENIITLNPDNTYNIKPIEKRELNTETTIYL
jgi:transcriptional regulator with XRE-family HTH domain